MKMTQVARLGHENLGKNPNDLQSFSRNLNLMPDVADSLDYRFENARLESFINWPVPFIDPRKLAAAGFYYIGTSDTVRCFECRTCLSGWLEGDDPEMEHQRWSGRCRFIRKLPCGNVPIGVDPSTVPVPKKIDVCGFYGLKYRPNSGPDHNGVNTPYTVKGKESCRLMYPKAYANMELKVFDGDSNTCNIVKLCDLKDSKHPDYISYDQRLRSYKSWPTENVQTKEDLAAAGLFYSGFADQTICFFCGGGLKDWDPTDVPTQEHIKWFPKCRFIQQLQAKRQEEQLKSANNFHTSSATEDANEKS